MRIIFVTSHPHLPQLYGGLQTSTDQLAKGLMNRGHHVAVLCGLMPTGVLALRSRVTMKVTEKMFGARVSKDNGLGYPVWRTWFPREELPYVVRKEAADLVIIMSGDAVGTAKAVKAMNVPAVIQLQNAEFQMDGGSFQELGGIPCIANSQFTAKKYHETYGLTSTVIYPFMATDQYETRTTRENITFINPHPLKGRDVAVAIARRCPAIPFVFVEAWPLEENLRSELRGQLNGSKNIKLIPAQEDMRNVYKSCGILIVPSIWEEAYGRVVTEAQVSGIPVIASNRGGLPEAVGPGGVVLSPDEIEPWVATIERLWNDRAYYSELSAAATEYSHREELTLRHQLDLYENAIISASQKPS